MQVCTYPQLTMEAPVAVYTSASWHCLNVNICMITQCVPIRGRLRDTVLDWEDPLPEEDLEKAEQHSRWLGEGLGVGISEGREGEDRGGDGGGDEGKAGAGDGSL